MVGVSRPFGARGQVLELRQSLGGTWILRENFWHRDKAVFIHAAMFGQEARESHTLEVEADVVAFGHGAPFGLRPPPPPAGTLTEQKAERGQPLLTIRDPRSRATKPGIMGRGPQQNEASRIVAPNRIGEHRRLIRLP